MDKVTLINLISGVIAVPLVQFIKSKLGIDNKLALALTVLVSFVVSAIVEILAGEIVFTNVDEFIKSLGLVLSTATIVYRILADSDMGQKVLKAVS